jgi:hypothetical protein
LAGFTESHALLECAKLSGVAFALRGGIVRNLIAAAAGKHPVPPEYRPSLFDLVDPFSDIDVVIEETVHWSRISAWIAAALPLASYFRWEFSSLQQVERQAGLYENIPLDRFLLWFRPDGQTVALDHFDRAGDAAFKLLRQGKIEGDLTPNQKTNSELALAATLKLIRYQKQFDLTMEADPKQWLDGMTTISLNDADRRRIEFHVLDALFAAPDMTKVLDEIKNVLGKLDTAPQSSGLLDKVKNLTPGEAIGAIVTPASASKGATAELKQVDQLPTADVLIPWTTLTTGSTQTTGTTDCCDYFAGGPIAVAMRQVSSFHKFVELQELTLDDIGVQARAGMHSEHRFAVPALHMIGTAGILRIDPRYPRTVLGDNNKWQVSLQQIRKPESSDEESDRPAPRLSE